MGLKHLIKPLFRYRSPSGTFFLLWALLGAGHVEGFREVKFLRRFHHGILNRFLTSSVRDGRTSTLFRHAALVDRGLLAAIVGSLLVALGCCQLSDLARSHLWPEYVS